MIDAVIDPARRSGSTARSRSSPAGTRGIGRAIAEAFAAAGAAVCVLARKPDELDETQAALADVGGPVVTVSPARRATPRRSRAAVAHCIDELGSLDILVNNAATNPAFGPMIETEPRAVRKVLEVNVEGPLLLAQAAWRAWMRSTAA